MSNNILNTEIWRDIAGYEGIYQVSNLGRVKRLGGYVKTKIGTTQWFNEKVLSIHINRQRNNRCTVNLCKDAKKIRIAVHRLVAFAFPEICGYYFDGADIGHKDTNPTNNKAENLHWVTKSGNMCNPLTIEHLRASMTEERRLEYSKRMKENNPSRIPGAWTEERRKAIADRTRGRHHTEESKKKMRGRIVSEETRIKLSNRAKIRERDEKGRYICCQ